MWLHTFECVLSFFCEGDRGLTGPPGEKPIVQITPHMKETMKGAKGDTGKMGEPGFTGPRGEYIYIYIVLYIGHIE